MTKFRKKPVVIEAVQFPITGSCPSWFMDAMTLPDETEGVATLKPGQIARVHDDLAVCTLEGVIWAKPGDYIIRGIKGELYPCKPDIFAATYDAV